MRKASLHTNQEVAHGLNCTVLRGVLEVEIEREVELSGGRTVVKRRLAQPKFDFGSTLKFLQS
jgi:hypothetical protein